MNFKSCVEEYKECINSGLRDYVSGLVDCNEKLIDSIKYSLMSGGKRIRGILLLAFFELFGGRKEDAIPFACAIEMLHTYSLIHDDLPCMDNDDIRRGKPSNHRVYGEDIALLAGDALLTMAFEVLSNQNLADKFGAEKIIRVCKILSFSAGAQGMVSGQADDLSMEVGNHGTEEIFKMYKKKTGMLIESSAEIGAVLSENDESKLALVKNYGRNVGLAFQLVDDLLDVVGQEEIIGKPVGSDISNKKFTYISVFGIEQTRDKIKKLTQDSLDILNKLGGNNEFLKCLTNQLETRIR